jgi:hypothetical protein
MDPDPGGSKTWILRIRIPFTAADVNVSMKYGVPYY